MLVYALGAVIGPIVAAVCMRLVGVGGLFAYTAAVHACIIVFAVHRLRQRTVSPSQEHISFADAMRVAGTVSSVDSISHPDEKPENGP